MNVTMKRNSNIGNVLCLACYTFRLHIPAHDSTSFDGGSHNRITRRDLICSWPAWELDLKKIPCRCPKLLAGRISLLIAHLGGKAYSLRSAIITATGHLVQKAFENAPGEDADAQGAPCIQFHFFGIGSLSCLADPFGSCPFCMLLLFQLPSPVMQNCCSRALKERASI